MIDAMDDFSDLFTLLVRSFLSSSVDTGKIDKLYEDQRAWYNKLRDSLAEAKYEYYFLGRKAEYVLMHKVVEAMQVQTHLPNSPSFGFSCFVVWADWGGRVSDNILAA
jgi:hypothetical protein